MTNKPSWQDEFDREFGNYDNSMFNVWKIGSAETSEKTFNQLKTFIQDLLDRRVKKIAELKKPIVVKFGQRVLNARAYNDALDKTINILKEE